MFIRFFEAWVFVFFEAWGYQTFGGDTFPHDGIVKVQLVAEAKQSGARRSSESRHRLVASRRL